MAAQNPPVKDPLGILDKPKDPLGILGDNESFQQPPQPTTTPDGAAEGAPFTTSASRLDSALQQEPSPQLGSETLSQDPQQPPEAVMLRDASGDEMHAPGLLDKKQRDDLIAHRQQILGHPEVEHIDRVLAADKAIREKSIRVVKAAAAAPETYDVLFTQKASELGDAKPYDWQNEADPRRQRLEQQAVSYGAIQFSPEKIASMKEAGAWTPRNEANYQAGVLQHASDVVDGKRLLLQRDVQLGKMNPETADATEKDLQAQQQYIRAGWEAVHQLDPRTVSDKLREKKQAETDARLLTGDPTGFTAAPVLKGLVVGTEETLVKPLLVAYDKLFTDDNDISVADRMINGIDELQKDMDATIPSEYKKPLRQKNEDGTVSWNPQGVIPQLAESAARMAPFLAMGAAGKVGQAAIFGSTYADTYEDFVQHAVDAGVPEKVAERYANSAALPTALLFSINPNLKATPLVNEVRAQALKAIEDGIGAKAATKLVLQSAAKGAATQVVIGALTEGAQNVARNAVDEASGSHTSVESDAFNSTVNNLLLGGIFGAGHSDVVTGARAESIRFAQEHPQEMLDVIEQSAMTKDQKVMAAEKLDQLVKINRGNDLSKLHPEKAAEFTNIELAAQRIQNDIKENPPSIAVKEVGADPREIELAAKAKQLREIKGLKEPEEIAAEEKKAKDAAKESGGEPKEVSPFKEKPKEPEKPAADDEVKKTVATVRAYEGEFREGVKNELEKRGLYRKVESFDEASAGAESLINEIGVEAALDAVRHNDVKGGAAAYIYKSALDGLEQRIQRSVNPDEIRLLEMRQAEMISELGDEALSRGRFGSALGKIYEESDLGFKSGVKAAEWEQKFGEKPPDDLIEKWKERDKEFEELKKKLDEAQKRADDAEANASIAAIKDSDAREKSRDRKKTYAQKAKVVADAVRKLKAKPMVFMDADGNPIEIKQMGFDWNGLVELGAKAIEKTGELADGVAAVLDKLKESEWYANMDARNKRAIAKQVEEAITKAAQGSVEAAGLKISRKSIREAVEAGAKDINELVAALRDEVKKDHPGSTDRQIRDAITEYGKRVNHTRDQISAEISRMKRIGKLTSQIEDARNKKAPLKSGIKRDKLDAEEKGLVRQLRELVKSIPLSEEAQKEKLATDLDAAKTRAKERIAELERRLKDGDFSKREKKKAVVDDELIKLNAEKIRLKEEYDKEFHKEKLRNRSRLDETKDTLWELWGLTRAIRATADLSFVLVQGGLLTVSNLWHKPQAVASAFKNMWGAFKSEKRADEWLREIKSQEWYPQAKEAGLAITQPHAEITAREELFVSEWTRLIWSAIGSPLRAVNKGLYERWKLANPFRALERGAVGYLDTLRVERFLDGMSMLDQKKAEGIEVTKQDYKDVAGLINSLSGRASLGPLEPAAQILTKVFFSPRLWASAIKTATPYGLYKFSRMTPTARKMAVADMGRFVGTTMGIVALAAAALNKDDDPETGVEMDPRSSDFGKIRLGDTRIDPWGGRVQQIVLMSRMTMGGLSLFTEKPLDAFKNSRGQLMPLGLAHKSPTMADVTLQMATNKLSPASAFVHDAMSTEVDKRGNRMTQYGEEYKLVDKVGEQILPIYAETVKELAKDDMSALDGFLMFYSFFGGGVQTYDDNKKHGK